MNTEVVSPLVEPDEEPLTPAGIKSSEAAKTAPPANAKGASRYRNRRMLVIEDGDIDRFVGDSFMG